MRRRLRLLLEEAIDWAVGLIPRSVLHPLLRAYRGLRQAASQRWLNEVASAGWYMLAALLWLFWLPLWFAVAGALGILLIHIAWRAVRSGTAGLGLALPLFVAAASLVWATGIQTDVRQELYETVAQVIPVFLIASAIDGRVLRQRATRSVRLVAAQLAGVLVIGEAAALLAVSRSDEASIPDWVFPVVVGALIGGGTAMVLSASLPDVDTRSELVVAKDESGDYDEIAAAVGVALPGTKIKVKPGRYSALKIRTPGLEIVGDGTRDEIIVEGRADPLYFAADRGRVEGITFIQEGKGQWFGIDISRGKLTVINCDITCSSLACVGIRGAAAALLRECRIHNGKKDGITCYAGASATIESCEIPRRM